MHNLCSTARLAAFSLLLLAGCRSQQVAFRFSPPHQVAQADRKVALGGPAVAEVAAAPDPGIKPGSEMRTSRRQKAVHMAQLRASPLAALRQAGRKVVAMSLAQPRRHRAAPAPTAQATGNASPLERNSLFIGLISSALGAGLIIAVGAKSFAASTLLLNTAHVLLVLGGLAMALWFVLLVLRASKER